MITLSSLRRRDHIMSISLFLFFACCTWSIYFFHLRIRSEDRNAYLQLVQRVPGARKHCLAKHPITITRWHHQKDLWLPEQTNRTHIQVTGEQSLLFLLEKDGSIDVREELLSVRAEDPQRTLTAQEASCFYRERLIDIRKEICIATRNRDSAIYADHCIYSFDLDRALLEGAPRVLVWEKSGKTFTAPQLEITAGEIRAKGEVRCTFSSEEQTRIDQIFRT
jgi:hypothetical protein